MSSSGRTLAPQGESSAPETRLRSKIKYSQIGPKAYYLDVLSRCSIYDIASNDARQQTARELSIISDPPLSRILILLPFRPAIGKISFSLAKRSRSSSLRPRSASTRAFLGLCSAAVDDEIVSDDAMALSDVEQ